MSSGAASAEACRCMTSCAQSSSTQTLAARTSSTTLWPPSPPAPIPSQVAPIGGHCCPTCRCRRLHRPAAMLALLTVGAFQGGPHHLRLDAQQRAALRRRLLCQRCPGTPPVHTLTPLPGNVPGTMKKHAQAGTMKKHAQALHLSSCQAGLTAALAQPMMLQGWLASASEFLKSLDPNHLIATGSEGFFGSSTPGASHRCLELCKMLMCPIAQPGVHFFHLFISPQTAFLQAAALHDIRPCAGIQSLSQGACMSGKQVPPTQAQV